MARPSSIVISLEQAAIEQAGVEVMIGRMRILMSVELLRVVVYTHTGRSTSSKFMYNPILYLVLFSIKYLHMKVRH
jgi:hypothetical protein